MITMYSNCLLKKNIWELKLLHQLLVLHPSQANNKDKKGGPLQKHLKFVLKLPKTNQPSTQLTPLDPTASQLLKDIVPAILSFLHYKLPLFCYWLNPNDLQKCCYFSQHKKKKKYFATSSSLLFSSYTAKILERVVYLNQGSAKNQYSPGARFSLCLFCNACELRTGFTFLHILNGL